jgi:hypothetical protein
VCLSTYAHVMAELGDTRGVPVEDQIRAARDPLTGQGTTQSGS